MLCSFEAAAPCHASTHPCSSNLRVLLLLLLHWWLQVLEGSTDPSAGPAIVAAGNAALAAASGSSGKGSSKTAKAGNKNKAKAKAGQGQGLCVKGSLLGLRVGAEVTLTGSWQQHETYGWQIK